MTNIYRVEFKQPILTSNRWKIIDTCSRVQLNFACGFIEGAKNFSLMRDYNFRIIDIETEKEYNKARRKFSIKITLEFLEKNDACEKAIQAWKDYGLDEIDVFECIEKLKVEQGNIFENYNEENSLEWATWLLPHCMELDDILKYVKYCKKLVPETEQKVICAAEWTVASEWAASVSTGLEAKAKWLVTADWAAKTADQAARAMKSEAEDTSLKIIDYGIELLKKQE